MTTATKTLFVILPEFPTFDAIAAIAVAMVFGKEYGWTVIWDWESRHEGLGIDTVARRNGWVVCDIREYDKTPREFSRVPKILNYMDEHDGGNKYAVLMESNPKLKALIRDLRLNNGARLSRDEQKLGGSLKRLPYSFVRLIRDLWNCVGMDGVPGYEQLMKMWVELAAEVIRPTELVANSAIYRRACNTMQKMGLPETSHSDHSLTLCGYMVRLWENGYTRSEISERARVWRELFRIAKKTEPTAQQAVDHIKAVFSIKGKRVAYLEVEDTRVAKQCWRVWHQGGAKRIDVMLVRRRGKFVIMYGPGASATQMVRGLMKEEPGVWHWETRFRANDYRAAKILMNGGATRFVQQSELTLHQLLGMLELTLEHDQISWEMALETVKEKGGSHRQLGNLNHSAVKRGQAIMREVREGLAERQARWAAEDAVREQSSRKKQPKGPPKGLPMLKTPQAKPEAKADKAKAKPAAPAKKARPRKKIGLADLGELKIPGVN